MGRESNGRGGRMRRSGEPVGPADGGMVARLSLAGLIAGLMVVVFHLLGNTVESVNSRSVFRWMVARWADRTSFGADYSVGWFVPFVSGWIVWRRRKVLAVAAKSVFWPGLVLVGGALFLHWAGARVQQPRLSLFSFVALVWAIPLVLLGWQTAQKLIFPCAYLLFCIPWNFLDALTFPLRRLSTAASAEVLNGMGLAIVRRGTMIFSATDPTLAFNVADPCSGLNSLLAMLAITALYANLTQRTFVRQWILFGLGVPLAMISNVFRVCAVAAAGRFFGKEIAMTIYHEYSAFLIFPMAIALMVLAGRLLADAGRGGSGEAS